MEKSEKYEALQLKYPRHLLYLHPGFVLLHKIIKQRVDKFVLINNYIKRKKTKHWNNAVGESPYILKVKRKYSEN